MCMVLQRNATFTTPLARHMKYKPLSVTHVYVVSQRYDLKGSLIGREMKHMNQEVLTVALKDADFIASKAKLQIGKIRKRMWLEQVLHIFVCTFV
jgi:hypothetical protein